MAETEGFEPSMELQTPYSLSRGAPSASRPRLQFRDGYHTDLLRHCKAKITKPPDLNSEILQPLHLLPTDR